MNIDKIIKLIGKGGFSEVYLVNQNGCLVARKDINYNSLSKKEYENVIKEVELLKNLRDRSVVIYKDLYDDKKNNKLYIYMEYCENGDLFQKIKEHRNINIEFSMIVLYLYFRK